MQSSTPISRLYNPSIGRFLQPDPLLELFPTQSSYSYAFNSPLNWKDPSGLFPENVKAFEESGYIYNFIGGDRIVRQKLSILGFYQGKKGVFEFIKEPDGKINHRIFISIERK